MIDGIKLDFTTAELARHLEDRVLHHRERENFYNEQAAHLERGAAGEEETRPSYANSSGGDPVKQLYASAAKHHRTAQTLAIIREHLVESETYRLEEGDLERLEFIRSGW